jgi:hypothetical protein
MIVMFELGDLPGWTWSIVAGQPEWLPTFSTWMPFHVQFDTGGLSDMTVLTFVCPLMTALFTPSGE